MGMPDARLLNFYVCQSGHNGGQFLPTYIQYLQWDCSLSQWFFDLNTPTRHTVEVSELAGLLASAVEGRVEVKARKTQVDSPWVYGLEPTVACVSSL